MTSYFQYGSNDVRMKFAAAPAGWPLARRARVTSLARCMLYSSWSILQMTLYLNGGFNFQANSFIQPICCINCGRLCSKKTVYYYGPHYSHVICVISFTNMNRI